MTCRVFIDGGVGTTGLEIRDRLSQRREIGLIELEEEQRKDEEARREVLRAADIAILCLPDDAARNAVALARGSDTRIIDASTAHRIADDWVYGFAELEAGHRNAIAEAARVANPGCYALTFVALMRPLVIAGLVPNDAPVSVNGTSGYSGGGKAMIAEFEDSNDPTAFRNYALGLQHKHLPEMQQWSGLSSSPLFSPSVANCYRGMIVEIPLSPAMLAGGAEASAVRAVLSEHYAGATTINVASRTETVSERILPIERLAGTDRLEIFVFSNEAGDQIRLVGILDNLGKGAAGSAVQNLNLMAGFEETAGLRL